MRILAALFALVVVFGAGFLAGRYSRKPETRLIDDAARPRLERLPSQSPTRLMAPEVALSSSRVNTDPETPPYAPLRAAALLASKPLLQKYRVYPFSLDELTPDFITLYELTPDEVARINAALKKAHDRINQLDAERATINARADGTATITVSPYPHEGGEIFDSVKSELLATLGPARSELFKVVSDFDSSDSTAFGGFGLRQMVIEVSATGPHGPGSMTCNTSIDDRTHVQTATYQLDAPALKDIHPAIYTRLIGTAVRR